MKLRDTFSKVGNSGVTPSVKGKLGGKKNRPEKITTLLTLTGGEKEV